MEPTDDQLAALADLAEVDHRIRGSRHKLDNLPEQQQLEQAKNAEAALEQTREQLEQARVDVDALTTKSDKEAAQFTDRIERERQRLYGGDLSTQQAINAVEREIESLERRLSEVETTQLEYLERADAIDNDLRENESALELATTAVSDAAANVDAAAGQLVAAIAEDEVARDKLRATLPEELLQRYDTRSAQGGRAFGKLEGNQCTACGLELPVGEANSLRSGDRLTSCPECRALLAVR